MCGLQVTQNVVQGEDSEEEEEEGEEDQLFEVLSTFSFSFFLSSFHDFLSLEAEERRFWIVARARRHPNWPKGIIVRAGSIAEPRWRRPTTKQVSSSLLPSLLPSLFFF